MEDKNAKENEVLEVKSKEFNNKFLFWVVMLVCFAWSIFQLFYAFHPINTTQARSIHLAFAVGIAFLLFPACSSKKAHTRSPFYDWILLIYDWIWFST